MRNMFNRLLLILVASAPLTLTLPSAFAAFIIDVSFQVHEIGQNEFMYNYKVSNLIQSDAPVYLWELSVDRDAAPTEFVNPPEWQETYFPGASEILWKTDRQFDVDPAFVILPGSSLDFSFISPLAPGMTSYKVVGLGFEFEGDDPIVSGSILGPSIVPSTVPEPGSLTLLCVGTLAVIASRGCSLRQWFRDSLAKKREIDSCP